MYQLWLTVGSSTGVCMCTVKFRNGTEQAWNRNGVQQTVLWRRALALQKIRFSKVARCKINAHHFKWRVADILS